MSGTRNQIPSIIPAATQVDSSHLFYISLGRNDGTLYLD